MDTNESTSPVPSLPHIPRVIETWMTRKQNINGRLIPTAEVTSFLGGWTRKLVTSAVGISLPLTFCIWDNLLIQVYKWSGTTHWFVAVEWTDPRSTDPRLQAVPFWSVERSETGARRNKREETRLSPSPPSARSLQFFRARLFRTPSTIQKGTACSLRGPRHLARSTDYPLLTYWPTAVGKSATTSCLDNSEKIIISFCSELNSSDIPISERHGFIEHSASGAGMKWHADRSAVDCRVSINMWPTAPIRDSVYPVYGFCKQTMSAGRRIFPSSPPPPSFISQPVVLSLRVTFDSLQPSRASSPKMTATKDYSALLLQKYACIAG